MEYVIYFKICYSSFSSLDKWSPALQIRTVLLSIQALLSAPNPDDPLANDVAEAWKTNEGQAIDTGLYFTSHLKTFPFRIRELVITILISKSLR